MASNHTTEPELLSTRRFRKTKTITLELARGSAMGDKVRFVPRYSFTPKFIDHPVAGELREPIEHQSGHRLERP